MKIAELQPKQGKVDIEAVVVSVGDVRTFEKFGKEGRVANATIKDDSGEVKLSLWNEQIDQVSPGAKIKISNGYVNEWQGEKQLTAGKFGTLEVLEGGEAPAEAPQEASEQPQEEQESGQSTLADEGEEQIFEDVEEERVE